MSVRSDLRDWWRDIKDAWVNTPGLSESADEYDRRRREADAAKWQAIKESKRDAANRKD